MQVVIPLKKINCVNQSENVQKPTQKYIEMVTVDNFDFWFMGVLKYQKTFKYLEQGDQIHAICKRDQLKYWKPILKENCTYMMHNFKVIKNDG